MHYRHLGNDGLLASAIPLHLTYTVFPQRVGVIHNRSMALTPSTTGMGHGLCFPILHRVDDLTVSGTGGEELAIARQQCRSATHMCRFSGSHMKIVADEDKESHDAYLPAAEGLVETVWQSEMVGSSSAQIMSRRFHMSRVEVASA